MVHIKKKKDLKKKNPKLKLYIHWTAPNFSLPQALRKYHPTFCFYEFHCWGLGSAPGQGTKIPQAAQSGQKK